MKCPYFLFGAMVILTKRDILYLHDQLWKVLRKLSLIINKNSFGLIKYFKMNIFKKILYKQVIKLSSANLFLGILTNFKLFKLRFLDQQLNSQQSI